MYISMYMCQAATNEPKTKQNKKQSKTKQNKNKTVNDERSYSDLIPNWTIQRHITHVIYLTNQSRAGSR